MNDSQMLIYFHACVITGSFKSHKTNLRVGQAYRYQIFLQQNMGSQMQKEMTTTNSRSVNLGKYTKKDTNKQNNEANILDKYDNFSQYTFKIKLNFKFRN